MPNPYHRLLNAFPWFGLAAFGVGLFIQWPLDSAIAEIEILMLFGASLLLPLALRLLYWPDAHPLLYRGLVFAYPAVVVAVGLAVLSSDLVAVLGALVWVAYTGGLALYGLSRFWARWEAKIHLRAEELCLDAGLLYVAVTGVWLLSYAAEFRFMTFSLTLVLLTAVHFTYISLGALVIAGSVGRYLVGKAGWGLYSRLAWGMLVTPGLVAVGITTTQFTGYLAVELLSVIMLASCFVMLVLVILIHPLPQSARARPLIVLSAGTLFITMNLAIAYPVGRATDWWVLTIPEMVRWHGWLNALAFAGAGLLAWTRVAPSPRPADAIE